MLEDSYYLIIIINMVGPIYYIIINAFVNFDHLKYLEIKIKNIEFLLDFVIK